MTPHNTTPIPTTCGQCHAPIWNAIIDGWTLNLDPTPLNTLTELQARLNGQHITQTIPNTRLHQLQIRTLHHIRATTQPSHILATHTCTPPPHPPLTPLWPTTPTLDLEEPPF